MKTKISIVASLWLIFSLMHSCTNDFPATFSSDGAKDENATHALLIEKDVINTAINGY